MDFAIKIIEISLVQKKGERYVALYLTPFIFAEESQSEAFTLFFSSLGPLTHLIAAISFAHAD